MGGYILRYFTLLGCLALLPSLCNAQRYTFRGYGQSEGLSNLTPTCMLQDREGFIWIATQNGIFRYDGFHFEPFSLNSGLPTHNVQILYEDASRRLWVGLENAVGFLQGGTFRTV